MRMNQIAIGKRYRMRLTTGRFVTVLVVNKIAGTLYSNSAFAVQQEDSGRIFLASAAKLRCEVVNGASGNSLNS
jgi:hypothetical protein